MAGPSVTACSQAGARREPPLAPRCPGCGSGGPHAWVLGHEATNMAGSDSTPAPGLGAGSRIQCATRAGLRSPVIGQVLLCSKARPVEHDLAQPGMHAERLGDPVPKALVTRRRFGHQSRNVFGGVPPRTEKIRMGDHFFDALRYAGVDGLGHGGAGELHVGVMHSYGRTDLALHEPGHTRQALVGRGATASVVDQQKGPLHRSKRGAKGAGWQPRWGCHTGSGHHSRCEAIFRVEIGNGHAVLGRAAIFATAPVQSESR